MKKTQTIIALALTWTMMIAGCGGKGSPTKKADTPEQAMENMRLAMLAGNKKAFINCFEANDAQKRVLGAMCELTSAGGELQQAMIKEYGEDAVKKMHDTTPGADMSAEDWLEQVKIKIEGDKAYVTKKGEKEALELIKKGGLWKISSWGMLGGKENLSDEELAQMMKMFEGMAKIMTDAKQKVGKAGYTAEKIQQEIGREIMGLMFSQTATPSFRGL